MANNPLPKRQPEWIDEAPVRIEAIREVEAPPSVVWKLVADHERWPQWFDGVDRVEVIDNADAVGGHRKVVVNRISFEEEFTAFDPEQRFAFTVLKISVPFARSMAECVTLEPLDDGTRTRVTYRQGFEPRTGFGWFLNSSRKRLERELRAGLDGLAVEATKQ